MALSAHVYVAAMRMEWSSAAAWDAIDCGCGDDDYGYDYDDS